MKCDECTDFGVDVVRFWQYHCLICVECGDYWCLMQEPWWVDGGETHEEPWPTTMSDDEYWEKYRVHYVKVVNK